MTRDDAMRLLGIDLEGRDSGAVEEAYASLAAEAARRIASTPTSALREKYRQQAERLRQARDLLLGDARPRNDPAPLSLIKRSGSGVGTRSAVAVAVALLLGAIVTFPVWRTWTDGSESNEADAKKTAGGIAEQVAELWLWHPRRDE
jgi:hypothetical protein